MPPLRSVVRGFCVVSAALFCALIPIQSGQAAILTVTSTADSGPGSLREAIASAAGGDIIQFDSTLTGQTITLTTNGLRVDTGITVDGPGASLLTVRRSDAEGTPAFAIFDLHGSNITLSGLTITNGAGGVIVENVTGNNVTIANCKIAGNLGTGVQCPLGLSGQSFTIINSTISGNTGNYGGGVYGSGGLCIGCVMNGGCAITINNTTISGNSATRGGGIYTGHFTEVINSTISGNTASQDQSGSGGIGGGIVNTGTLTVANSTISGNSAHQGGGVLHTTGPVPFFDGSAFTLTNSTITANTATDGGGIYSDVNEFALGQTRNSIIALNLAASPDIAGSMRSEGFNLIGNNFGATIVSPQVSDQIGTSSRPIDPLLGPLQDNGGHTFTHALLLGSPAIDQGHSSGSTTDQRGFGRPVDLPDIPNAPDGDGADIGAFESAGIANLANISTRVAVGAGGNSLIGGFIITGTQPKTVLIRGLGPSLLVSGALADPIIEVHVPSGEVVATNDNWRDALSSSEITESGLAPSNDLESALWGVINPGSYTVVVRGQNNSTGIGLFEVYDLDQTANSRLGNISTRGVVGTGNDVMVAGTIITGNHSPMVLLRAIGPSLTSSGVPDALQDPVLELHDGNGGLIISNDNWRSNQEAEIIATGIPPTNDQESAILQSLVPGSYTAIVRGVNNTTGVAVVEAYNLN